MAETCKCGDTSSSFHPDENQYEPNCWICYDNKGKLANDCNVSSPAKARVKSPAPDDYDDLPF